MTNIAILGNLYANNADRNPWFKGGSTGIIANNFIYNPGVWAIRLGYNPKEWQGRMPPAAPSVAIIGNVMQHGENTPPTLALVGSNAPDRQGRAYMVDNVALTLKGELAPQRAGGVSLLQQPPYWPSGLALRRASLSPDELAHLLKQGSPAPELVRDMVLNHSGARPADRDSVDLRLIADIRAGKGRHIDSQDDVGGYPSARLSQRALQVPARGIEAWLDGFSAAVEGR